MNILHCNDCGSTEDVSHVVLTVDKQVAVEDKPGLAKNDRLIIEGDLCARCLKAVSEMVEEKDMTFLASPRVEA